MSCIILGTQNHKVFGVGGEDSQESSAAPPCWERRNNRTSVTCLVTGRLTVLAGLELSSLSSCLTIPFSKSVVIADVHCIPSMCLVSVWFYLKSSPQWSCVRSVMLCEWSRLPPFYRSLEKLNEREEKISQCSILISVWSVLQGQILFCFVLWTIPCLVGYLASLAPKH